jgi:hypothetical protein
MRILPLVLLALLAAASPAHADVVDDAFSDARAAFERAAPALAAGEFGVDIVAYGEALAGNRFASTQGNGQPLRLGVLRGDGGGSCDRYAAYVTLPPRDGEVTLVVCPQFRESGTPALRMLTVLHEVVHAVAGPSECRAMAFAARVEHLATGTHTPVDRYWRANGCEGSAFTLP